MPASPTGTPTGLGRLHVIVDAEDVAVAALAGGAPTIQVRLKAGTDRSRLALVERIVGRCADAGAQCIVNDRLDFALAAGATGVHVGADDLPVATVRRLADASRVAPAAAGLRPASSGAATGPLLIGGTARDPATARRLVDEGASYLGVGPVFATSSKDGLPDPIGLGMLAAVVAAVDVPVIAIAGITAERVPAVLDTGAWGVAVIGAVAAAADPAAATAELVAALAPRGSGDGNPANARFLLSRTGGGRRA
jgi:thiamine-phosphate pyrophosphorylase